VIVYYEDHTEYITHHADRIQNIGIKNGDICNYHYDLKDYTILAKLNSSVGMVTTLQAKLPRNCN
jgi:hypothetical protein